MSVLEIKDLHVGVETKDEGLKPILRGVDLTIRSGETHAIMGPNGSGKSTLASALAGHPKYKITKGTVTLDGQDVLAMTPDERARAGLFLAMQYPVEVPGVSVANFLRTAKTALGDGTAPPLRAWGKEVNTSLDNLRIDPVFLGRSVNEGFSGGEKKRHEILQLELFKPKFAILDETDSGLDVDALRVVSAGVNRALETTDVGILLITHYTRILRYIKPDFVHVFVDGRVAEEGGPELADELEENGYDRFYAPGQAVAEDLANPPQNQKPRNSVMVDWAAVRAQFPLLERTVRGGQPLVYLDSASTSQKPIAVLDKVRDFYEFHNGAVHRGAHQVAEEATELFESARVSVAKLIAAEAGEVVFTPGATAGLNLLAYAFGNASLGRGGPEAEQFALGPGDEIVVTELEHHSNLVPWQELCARTGATLRWFGITDDGRIDLSNIDEIINPRTRVVAFTHASNVTGAITDVPKIVEAAKAVGALTVLDACQSIPHLAVDIHKLGVDFAAFSGHKMFAPTGVGALFGKRDLLEALPPVSFGGSMVESVFMDHATYLPPPEKFEAGTQMVAQAVGFGAAADWLSDIGMENVEAHERRLAAELLKVGDIPGVRVIGPQTPDNRLAVVSFVVDGVHPHDVGQVLDDAGIAIRAGQHCAQPLHRHFHVPATVRASASVYTNDDDIAALRTALGNVREFFGYDGF